jgi:uncharacterized protein DUF6896
MSFFKSKQAIDPAGFALALAARLGTPSGTSCSLEPLPGPLPGNPWSRRLVVALEAHVLRQRWVAKVVRDSIQVGPMAIASDGAFGHPSPPNGQVPELPDWSYMFHGVGCCFTHLDGIVIDVDFDEYGADSVDPYFYGRYLASLPHPSGVEATLRRPRPLDDWWMAELDSLRGPGWIEGDHRVRVTSLGARWAEALTPAFQVMSGAQDSAERLRAALLVEDFPWAAQMGAAPPPTEVQLRAAECAALRASQLERELRASRARGTFSALAVLDGARAAPLAEKILGDGPLDGLTSLALDYLLAREAPPEADILLSLATRARGTAPPAPHLRTLAILTLLKGYRADSVSDRLRGRVLDALLPDAHSGEGIAAALHWLLDPEPGLVRLERCLRSTVPLARADAAAAFVLIGTPEAAAALRRCGDAAEAKTALALLRGVPPAPGPRPVGEVIDWRGAPRRVYSADEILAAGCPSLVKSQLTMLSTDLGPLLERWWSQ